MSPINRYLRIRNTLHNWQQPGYRYKQLLHAIFKQRIGSFSQMHNLPLDLRQSLIEKFGDDLLSVHPISESSSAQANRVLFGLQDGNRIETVAMRYRAGWHSYCISSQSGCGFACQFCATGTIGLKRNLSANHICDQILYFHLAGLPIDSISFMGMGEALANPNTFEALHILTNPALFALSPRRITVSTIGLLPALQRLSTEFPQVNLTFSLHSPFNQQRSQLIPANRRFPIEDVLSVLDEHISRTGRKVYIAYLLLKGENDSSEHAQALADLITRKGRQTRLFHVNLIQHNASERIAATFQRPDRQTVLSFKKSLEDSHVKVTVRPSFGAEINAACGQLYGEYQTREALMFP